VIKVPLPRQIDRFEVLDTLGRGGTATVFRVRDPASGQELALKLLDGTDEFGGALQRFEREFEAMKNLEHPHIVRPLSRGIWQGQSWFTMEVVEGPTLKAWLIENGPLSVDRGIALMTQAADALGAAHSAGVVHRDVKPANLVLFDEAWRLKILDFGLVKGVDASASLTAAGQVVGTPVWMAPERLQTNTAAEPTWDVYALGLVFYEALTGKNPFRGRNLIHTIRLVPGATAPVPSSWAEGLPVALDRLLLRSLSREPEDRPRDGNAVAALLRQLGSD